MQADHHSDTRFKRLWVWFVAPRWFRAAIAALMLLALGIGIGLTLAPDGGPPPPLGAAPAGQSAPLNLPALSVEGRRLPGAAPEPVPMPETVPMPVPDGVAGAPPPDSAPVEVTPEPDAEPAPATGDVSAPAATRPPARDWQRAQDDLFGAGAPAGQ